MEAACAARTAIRCFTKNPEVMNEVYKTSRDRMTPADVGKLRIFENNLETVLAQRRIEADVAK